MVGKQQMTIFIMIVKLLVREGAQRWAVAGGQGCQASKCAC